MTSLAPWLNGARMDAIEYRHDAALSYAFSKGDEEHREISDRVVVWLERAGLSVFRIPEENALETKRWRRQYYEGIFRSRYLIPVVTSIYLEGQGSREELEEIELLARKRRSTTFFHPLVSIAVSVEDIRRRASGHDDGSAFEWLETHTFPVYLEWGEEAFVTFFRSLARGSNGAPNLDWLRVLARHITSVTLDERLGHPTARVQIENPMFDHHFEFQIGPGGTRYAGCLFESRSARRNVDPLTIVDEVEHHVMRPAQPREPRPGEVLQCDNCGCFDLPLSFDIGAECPRCGEQMSKVGAESARRVFTYRFGKKS